MGEWQEERWTNRKEVRFRAVDFLNARRNGKRERETERGKMDVVRPGHAMLSRKMRAVVVRQRSC